jgi:hypothetical protein
VICGHCGVGALAIGPVETVVYDLAVQCYNCNGISTAPPWSPGRAIGLPHVVAVAGTEISASEPLQLTTPVAIMTYESAEARHKELVRLSQVDAIPGRQISVDYLASLLEQGVALLGNRHRQLYAKHVRLQRSAGSKNRPHPLMYVLDDIRDIMHGVANGEPRNPRQAIMLAGVLDVISRWEADPLGVAEIAKLKDGKQFWHNVILFALGQQLARFGNDVELYATREGGRTADLRIVTNGRFGMHIEVKTPEELLPPYHEIDADQARSIVFAKFDAAGTGSRGQLPPEQSGVLCIGGVMIGRTSRDYLTAALSEYFARPQTGTHLGGGLIASMEVDQSLLSPDRMAFHSVLSLDWVQNPNYLGGPIEPPSLDGEVADPPDPVARTWRSPPLHQGFQRVRTVK